MGMKNKITGILLAAAALTLSSNAFAGQTYVDKSGYAVSGYDVVAFFDMDQATIGEAQPAPVAGIEYIFAEYNGAKYAFSTMENRARFMKNPAKFAPQFDGHCSYAVTRNIKQPGNPAYWRIVDGKLYFTKKASSYAMWQQSFFYYITAADDTWADTEYYLASKEAVPGLAPNLAPNEG